MKIIYQICFLCNFQFISLNLPVQSTEQELLEFWRSGNGYMVRSRCLACGCVNTIYSDNYPIIYEKGGEKDDKGANSDY